MTVRTELPRPIRRIEHVWIPLADGAGLAGRIRLLEDAEAEPVPAILEYLPQEQRDGLEVLERLAAQWCSGRVVAHTPDAEEGEERMLARTSTLTFPRDGV